KMVALTHMSNVTGTIVPIADVIERAHARGIPVLVDGSQGAVHLKVDVQALGVDFYVFTGHKLYGPTGIGVLYGRYDLLQAMRPYQGGGEMIDTVTLDKVTYNDPPHRFEAGTPPIVQAIGLGAAIDYVEALGRDAIAAHEHEIAAYASEKLKRINSLRLIGDAPGKGGIFSFELKGAHAHDVSTILDRYGIAIRAGTHCAQPLLQRFGVTSTCRASLALYSGKDDIDALVDGIEKAQKFFA
ncbi:MAG TPA: cysteine desulfurase, partial [Devosia sp.]|nr:cysteine desulfurase [Devosia sp.]